MLVFDVSKVDLRQLPKLIAEASKIKCRIEVDFEKSTVNANPSNSEDIDQVIDIVSRFFEIKKVNIISDDNVNCSAPNLLAKGGSILDENSEEKSLEKPIPFYEPSIRESLNSLAKAAFWSLKVKNADSAIICNFINSAKMEISRNYGDMGTKEFSVGDLVDVDYGEHVAGEISGSHVPAIVVGTLDSRVYLVPIEEETLSATDLSLVVKFGKDVVCNQTDKDIDTERRALLDMGSYVSSKRVNSVLGRCTEEFFSKLIEVLPEAFCFNDIAKDNAIATDTETGSSTSTTEESKDTTVADKSIQKDSDAKSKLKQYVLEQDTFTVKELKERFGEVSSIGQTIHYMKKKGQIESTDKRGEYRVVKK